jgi:hypothetical protein
MSRGLRCESAAVFLTKTISMSARGQADRAEVGRMVLTGCGLRGWLRPPAEGEHRGHVDLPKVLCAGQDSFNEGS